MQSIFYFHFLHTYFFFLFFFFLFFFVFSFSFFSFFFFFFFNDTATTEIYTLSLHDALPILSVILLGVLNSKIRPIYGEILAWRFIFAGYVLMTVEIAIGLVLVLNLLRSEEHTSELQSQSNLVCRLLLEKKKKKKKKDIK